MQARQASVPAIKAPARTPEELDQVARFKQLTEQVLPAMAAQSRWPIRFDHCFKRICLDWAFHDVWYRHLPRPAERHLYGDALRRALACAQEIAADGLPVLECRDAASLRWRGKQGKGRAASPSVPVVETTR